jgi:hypothetical protein
MTSKSSRSSSGASSRFALSRNPSISVAADGFMAAAIANPMLAATPL